MNKSFIKSLFLILLLVFFAFSASHSFAKPAGYCDFLFARVVFTKWRKVQFNQYSINVERRVGARRDYSIEYEAINTLKAKLNSIATTQPLFQNSDQPLKINDEILAVVAVNPEKDFVRDGVVRYRLVHGIITAVEEVKMTNGRTHSTYTLSNGHGIINTNFYTFKFDSENLSTFLVKQPYSSPNIPSVFTSDTIKQDLSWKTWSEKVIAPLNHDFLTFKPIWADLLNYYDPFIEFFT